MLRASAALRAMATTVQSKADHDSGCEVQDDSNVRQPGPSHHPTLTTIVWDFSTRNEGRNLKERWKTSTRQNHKHAYLPTKKVSKRLAALTAPSDELLTLFPTTNALKNNLSTGHQVAVPSVSTPMLPSKRSRRRRS
jgi:hypothetical protein